MEIRRKKRQQRTKLVAAIVILSAILIALLLLAWIVTPPKICGLWSVDGVTKYRFFDDTRGAMILPHGEFAFTYTIHGDRISIDFADEHLIDAEYEFTLERNTLVFKDSVAEYVMTRED